MEVNNDTLITKTDRTGKREFRKKNIFISKKRQNNCEKLNTRFHAKFPAAILKNPYYTPPLRDMTCCISDLSYIFKIKQILSKYMIIYNYGLSRFNNYRY